MNAQQIVDQLKLAKRLIDANAEDRAFPLVMEILQYEPENPAALHMLGYLYLLADKQPLAYVIYQKLTRDHPGRPEFWNNLGRCCDELHKNEEAIEAFKQSLKIDPTYKAGYNNIATALVNLGRYEEALTWARESLKFDAEYKNAWTNIGFASLALHDWQAGFDGFANALGGKYRAEWNYGDAAKWNGEKGANLVVYGEQGIGDEIMAAQMLNDAAADCKRVVYDCHPRLANLFARSFPNVQVYGTRKETDVAWIGRESLDYKCALFDLGRWYRNDAAKFPREPYLKADPERVLQWKSLFKSWGKPVIGIAWRGGNFATGSEGRNVGLEAFRELIEGTDAVFVALEYKDCAAEIAQTGLPVKWYPRATMAEDYDETAGLIAALDEVVGIHTSALHMAGALGVPVTCLVPEIAQWRYHRDDMPWYRDFRLFKQHKAEPWASVLHRLCVDRGVSQPVEQRIDWEVADGTAAGERAQEVLNRIATMDKPKIAEIGVYKGDLSRRVLQRPDVEMILIDPWGAVPPSQDYIETDDPMALMTESEWQEVMQEAANGVAFAADRVRFLRGTSKAARAHINGTKLDCVFIDGDHSYSGTAQDISLWWDAVRPGGWLGGHDYRTDKPFGVVQAVDEFVAREGLRLHRGRNMTWWVRKPA